MGNTYTKINKALRMLKLLSFIIPFTIFIDVNMLIWGDNFDFYFKLLMSFLTIYIAVLLLIIYLEKKVGKE